MHKEIWTKNELKDFGVYCNGEVVQDKYGLSGNIPSSQQEMNVAKTNRLNHIQHQKRLKAIKAIGSAKEQQNDDELSAQVSVWSDLPPSPRAANEKLIWRSKLHAQNQVTRGQNGAIGRLGDYSVGDPDARIRLI